MKKKNTIKFSELSVRKFQPGDLVKVFAVEVKMPRYLRIMRSDSGKISLIFSNQVDYTNIRTEVIANIISYQEKIKIVGRREMTIVAGNSAIGTTTRLPTYKCLVYYSNSKGKIYIQLAESELKLMELTDII